MSIEGRLKLAGHPKHGASWESFALEQNGLASDTIVVFFGDWSRWTGQIMWVLDALLEIISPCEAGRLKRSVSGRRGRQSTVAARIPGAVETLGSAKYRSTGNADVLAHLTRREFAKMGLLAVGATAAELGAFADKPGVLPTVRWGNHDLTKL